jgi:hypothetical protein
MCNGNKSHVPGLGSTRHQARDEQLSLTNIRLVSENEYVKYKGANKLSFAGNYEVFCT